MTGRNHEVTTEQKLLDDRGNIAECGWSRQQLQQYDRQQIKAPKFRIKEWDYYLVIGQGFGVAFTISDDGYVGLQSVSLLDFEKPWEHTETVLDAFPMGKLAMPCRSDQGDVCYDHGRLHLEYVLEKGGRHIRCRFTDFFQGKDLSCDIFLQQPPMDTMVIATPWEKQGRFYYNQKINCMRADGWVMFDGRRYVFDPKTDFGTLDWGRGVWTYDNTWFWGSGNCDLQGKPFGFNIGYGFGNTRAASENILFYDGVAHKLDDVTFCIPENDYMSPWKFTSSDHRFEMDFVPIIDRSAKLDYKVILSDQHQVFGRMSGQVVLDDGRILSLERVLCFAEKVHNKY
jgi:hypothetical protein